VAKYGSIRVIFKHCFGVAGDAYLDCLEACSMRKLMLVMKTAGTRSGRAMAASSAARPAQLFSLLVSLSSFRLTMFRSP